MATIVGKVDIGTTSTSVVTLGPYRQILLAGSAEGVVYDVFAQEASAGVTFKIGRIVANGDGSGSLQFPNGIDCSLFYKYAVVSGTPGANIQVWVQANLLYPAT